MMLFVTQFNKGEKMKKLVSVCAITALIAGCTTVNPYTGQTQTSKATWGTAIGAATGASRRGW